MSGDARPADVGFRSPSLQEEPELVRWHSDGGPEHGTLSEVAGFYRSLERGRLMILGEPGSGKTVLATQLVLDLIKALPRGEWLPTVRPQVPVWLSLTSLDLGEPASLEEAGAPQLAARLDQWIAEQLSTVYQVRARVAEELLGGHWIVPVLDGLDEMDPAATGQSDAPRPRAAAVVRALNDGTGRRPVVLVCRRAEYRQLAQSAVPAGEEPLLLDASQIVLQPLEPGVICQHLSDRFPGSAPGQIARRWKPVLLALEAAAPDQAAGHVLEVLASPWRLFLAVMAYHSDDTDPAEILQHSGDTAPSRLMEQLIPAATALTPAPAGGRYPPDKVKEWLTTLACHLHDTSEDPVLRWSPTDLILEQLWPIAGVRRVQWRYGIARLVVLGVPFAVAGLIWVRSTGRWFPDTLASWIGLIAPLPLIVLVACLGAIRSQALRRLDLASLRFPAGRRRLAITLAFGLPFGLAVGQVAGQVAGQAVGSAFWLVVGLAAGLAIGLAGQEGSFRLASRPTSVMSQNAAYFLAVGLVVGLVVGLAVGLVVGPAFGLAVGLGVGLAVGLVAGLDVWIRYVLSCRLARRHGLLPPRVGLFLDWAYKANLLRMSGIAGQFRHRELQDWLFSPHQPKTDQPAANDLSAQADRDRK